MINKSWLCAVVVLSGCFAGGEAVAQTSADGFDFSGQIRARFESLDGQYRQGLAGSDQAFLMRSLFHGRYVDDDFVFGVEIQDSRGYLHDSGTPLSSSYVNAFDALQVYIRSNEAPSIWDDSASSMLTFGRQTISVASKRQLERASFANVIKSYTGVYWKDINYDGDEMHSFYVVPIERYPNEREDVDDNVIKADKEQWNRRLWGLYYRKHDIIADLFEAKGTENTWGELFLYGFEEKDDTDTQTVNRHYVTSGFRLYRDWAPQRWNFDLEGAYRKGTRHATSSPLDNDDLTVSANKYIIRVGYTFDHPYNPNLAFQYYYASGDDRPGDGAYGQFERLFGGRRTDLNNTSIHGPLTPANISAVGFRFTLTPDENWDARLHYSSSSLAEGSDRFVIGKYQDPSGNSGDYLGHMVDTRFRYWFGDEQIKRRWIFEAGVSLVFPGEYIKAVRTAESATNPAIDYQRTTFGYAQVTYNF